MDIVERLRNYDYDFDGKIPALKEAANEIERLREALRQISLLPCEWVVHEIAVAALKETE